MTLIVSGVVAAILAVAVIGALNRGLRDHAERLAQAAQLADSFYEAAQRLVRHERTPDSVLRIVDFLASNVGKAWMARSFVMHVVFAKNSQIIKNDLSRDLDRLDVDQRRALAQTVATAMLSSALADMFFASIYLNLISTILTKSGRAGDAPSEERAATAAMDLALHAGICTV